MIPINKFNITIAILAVFLLGAIFLFSKQDTSTNEPTRELRILQWSHFVPRYDTWFDEFAKEWGRENDVNVIVDHVNISELNDRITSEVAVGEGHDLYEHLSPPASFESDMIDLTDVNQEAQNRLGRQSSICTKSSYNETTDVYFGFCHGWVPDPGNYRQSLWERAGKPDGPEEWQDLLEHGRYIKGQFGVGMGLGMSQELDSNMVARALLWSFGASVQDENEQVVINSPETVAALNFMAELYRDTMTDEVFSWDAASNNQALISGRASYILNSISAYRTAQKTIETVASDISFVPPLKGPSGEGLAGPHVVNIYTIPKFSENSDIAKQFLLHLAGNYDEAVLASELYNFPAFQDTAPEIFASEGWLESDPYGSEPSDKLSALKNAQSWTVNVGYPGPANAAIGEVFDTFILPQMFARVARGEMTAEESVTAAENEIEKIFSKWRDRGLVGPKQ